MAVPASVAMFILAPLFPSGVPERQLGALIYSSVAAVSLVPCITLHPLLVRLDRQRLHDYLIAYAIAVLPILLSSLSPHGFDAPGFITSIAVLLSPSVMLFWWLYYRALPGAGKLHKQIAEADRKLGGGTAVVPRLALALVVGGVAMFLSRLVVLEAARSTCTEPYCFDSSVTPLESALMVMVWGAVTQCVLTAIHRNDPRLFALSFLLFSVLFEAIMLMVFVLVPTLTQAIRFGPLHILSLLGYGEYWREVLVFHPVFFLHGLLIWWLYHKGLRRLGLGGPSP